MRLGLVVRPIHEGACAWIPSPPQRVIGPVAYYPLEGGDVMKEPPPSLIVAGLANEDWKIARFKYWVYCTKEGEYPR